MINNELVYSQTNKFYGAMNLYGAFFNELQHKVCYYDENNLWNEYFDNTSIEENDKVSSVKKYEQVSPVNTECHNNWWKHLIAGGLAGAVSRSCTAPLDRLKITLQAYGSSIKTRSMGQLLKQMTTEGGVTSLWRGNGINVVKVMPELALKFMIYDELKKLFKIVSIGNEINIFERFAAGSLAGFASQSLIFPLEVIKTRMVLRKTGETLSQCVDDIFRLHSNSKRTWKQIVRPLYRGYVPNMLGIVPYAGIDLAVYETLKHEYVRRQSVEKSPSALVCLACGVISSSTGQLVSYPLNLIRTKLIAKPVHSMPMLFCATNGPVMNNPTVEMSRMSEIFYSILRQEGVRGFYRGLCANLIKVAPSVAVTYVVYEQVRHALGGTMT